MSDYRDLIRGLRGARSFRDFAAKSNIHASVLCRLESGERQPNLGHLQKLARAFGMSLPGLLKKVGK